MRLLLLNQFFHPDSAATSQLLTGLAEELAAQGHDVRVVAANSTYAPGRSTPIAGVEVRHVRTPAFKNSVAGRLASYASYVAGALKEGMFGPRMDCVVTLTTPPGLSLIGAAIKRIRGARHICWEMDLYPDIAVALGVLSERSLLTRAAAALFRNAMKSADAVIALGPCMKERLASKGLEEDKIHIVDNWADGSLLQPRALPPMPLTLLYSGNLGRAHDIETIKAVLPAAPVRWIFAGGGPLRPALEEHCRAAGLANIEFRPYCEMERLGHALGEAHIGLVTQRPESLGRLVPSKTYGILAAGRPVLFIGPRQSTPALIIARHRCGWQLEPGDTHGLLRLLERLAADTHEIREFGFNARNAFYSNYDKSIALDKLTRIITASEPHQATAAAAATL